MIRLPRRIVSKADLAYVALALAQRLSLPLVTANEPLFRRLEGIDLDVHWLGRWPA